MGLRDTHIQLRVEFIWVFRSIMRINAVLHESLTDCEKDFKLLRNIKRCLNFYTWNTEILFFDTLNQQGRISVSISPI